MKYLLQLLALLVFFTLFGFSCGNAPSSQEAKTEEEGPVYELPPVGVSLPVSPFGEIWAYVVAGREAALKPGLPLSDIGYFGAEIGMYGSLIEVPERKKLPAFSGRVHMVVKCDSRSLTHFILVPGSHERKTLVADLVSAAKNFDGLQIDFEYIPQRDGDNFISFLGDIRAALGGKKMFTIALPARFKKINNDVYDYAKIKPLVDRILVMAYDEHWSTSKPGPIASLSWCNKVAEYCMGVIGKEKLIMGIPFYGRAWGDTTTSQAYMYAGIERIYNQYNAGEINREEGIPTFEYTVPVKVTVYYDDEYSLSVRMEMYRTMGITSIGFWRLGQETPAIWQYIKLMKNEK